MTQASVIKQVQQAALDSSSPLSAALRKAKVACAKLGLTEFERWVDLELNGYMDEAVEDMPKYRIILGTPKSYNPYHGWHPIIFHSSEQMDKFSEAPVGMSVGAIEVSLQNRQSTESFAFPYSGGRLDAIRRISDADVHIDIAEHQISNILESVRNILLQWTLELEKNGVVGNNETFDAGDKAASQVVTDRVINQYHINIGQVGSFVQGAENSTVFGSVSGNYTAEAVQNFLDQIEATKGALPLEIRTALDEPVRILQEEISAHKRPSIISQALGSIRTICEAASGNLVAAGIISLLSLLRAG